MLKKYIIFNHNTGPLPLFPAEAFHKLPVRFMHRLWMYPSL